MQISLKWLNELLNTETVEVDSLVEKLTLGGFEVEEILELKISNQKQIVLDISATANRSDSLSIQGISREIAALLKQPIKPQKYFTQTEQWKEILKKKTKTIPNADNCLTFIGIVIQNLNNLTVPKWIQNKLVSSGIAPSNTLLDFQNYLLLETGYPLEFYDFDKICSKLNTSNFNLSIKTNAPNQTFLASNDLTYELNDSILTVNANNSLLSIAGIVEAKEFSCSQLTNSLLLEGSIFKAAKIRQQSRKLGLRTERSARYEKSLRNTYLIEALYRLISLLRISNPNLSCQLYTIKEIAERPIPPILLRYETVKEILGPINNPTLEEDRYITPKTIKDYLTRLNFEFTYDDSKLIWTVQIPHSRTEDLIREIDLIEEIGRLHGFNNFVTTLPKIKVIGNQDSTYKTRKKITSCLLNLGLNELIHYSLIHQTTFVNNEVKLVNPLLSDCSSLRSSLLPNLIKTVQENLKQKNVPIEGFEYGHVFSLAPKEKFIEKEHVAGIFGGIKTKISWENMEFPLTWFEAKGKIEQLLNQLNLKTYWKKCLKKDREKLFHPYRSAEIYLENNRQLGVFGQIHPILVNQLNIPSEIYMFEFDVEIIEYQLQQTNLTLYKSYPLYPKIIKDLSFIVHRDITFEEIQNVLYWNGTEFLSEIHLLDEYKGQSIPKHHTSLCLQLTFQSNQKTLENKEIENIISNLQSILVEDFNANIRN